MKVKKDVSLALVLANHVELRFAGEFSGVDDFYRDKQTLVDEPNVPVVWSLEMPCPTERCSIAEILPQRLIFHSSLSWSACGES